MESIKNEESPLKKEENKKMIKNLTLKSLQENLSKRAKYIPNTHRRQEGELINIRVQS